MRSRRWHVCRAGQGAVERLKKKKSLMNIKYPPKPAAVTIEVALSLPTAVEPSPHVAQVAALFGLGLDGQRSLTVVPPTTLTLRGGEVVFVTGLSGSGKSCLLRLIEQKLGEVGGGDGDGDEASLPDGGGVGVIRFDHLPALADRPLVDCFGAMPLERVLAVLSLAGLNDAFVMLRRPGELSDGQRYRLRLAQTMAMVEQSDAQGWWVILADEFGGTLDRVTAHVLGRNVRKWTRSGKGWLLSPPTAFIHCSSCLRCSGNKKK